MKNYHKTKYTPEQRREIGRKRYAKVDAIIQLHKSKPCVDCGITYPPYVMDFHHNDPSTKAGIISEMRFKRRPIELIEAEIGKCVVICSNCHRVRTHLEKSYSI